MTDETATSEQLHALIASLGDFSQEPPACVAVMRAHFNESMRGKGAALPPYFEATAEDIDAYSAWRWPRGHVWVLTGSEGHRGIPFKGVPLTLAGGKEYW